MGGRRGGGGGGRGKGRTGFQGMQGGDGREECARLREGRKVLSGANAMNEEDPERDRATQV